jgi:hypothetical protein
MIKKEADALCIFFYNKAWGDELSLKSATRTQAHRHRWHSCKRPFDREKQTAPSLDFSAKRTSEVAMERRGGGVMLVKDASALHIFKHTYPQQPQTQEKKRRERNREKDKTHDNAALTIRTTRHHTTPHHRIASVKKRRREQQKSAVSCTAAYNNTSRVFFLGKEEHIREK